MKNNKELRQKQKQNKTTANKEIIILAANTGLSFKTAQNAEDAQCKRNIFLCL